MSGKRTYFTKLSKIESNTFFFSAKAQLTDKICLVCPQFSCPGTTTEVVMELIDAQHTTQQVLLAELNPASVEPFSELFGTKGLKVVHARSALEVRSLRKQVNFCACIVVDDLEDIGGLEMVRELHQFTNDIPLVLIADLQNRRIPLEEVSIGWNGCYMIKDSECKYIDSAYSWIDSTLNTASEGHPTDRSRFEASESRELLHSQRLESVGMLASGIAHDFNNILMAILGNASIAKDKIGRDHEAFRFVNIIEQCAERASALSNSLMRYAKGEKSDWVPISLPDHIDELLNLIGTGLPGHVKIEKDFESVPPVEGDATKLQQVIMNLCLNAGDAMNERKLHATAGAYVATLHIAIHPAQLLSDQIFEHTVASEALERGFIRVDISDNGIGMSASTVQNIFRPFFTTKKSGRGLGLSSVRGVVEEHGGFIEVSSEPGSGTTFSMYLPCCEVTVDEPEDVMMGVLSSSAILVIEPDEESRRLIGLSLQFMDYQVLLVESLDEGLAAFLNHSDQVAMILMKIDDPSQGARQALESLRRVNENVPIVVTCGAPREQVMPLIRPNLADCHVPEPIQPDVLLRVIAEILRKRSQD